MVVHSLTARVALFGTTAVPIHRRAAPVSHQSQFTQTSPPALFPLTTQMELCGPAMCSPRPASHLQLHFQTVGPTAWTPKARVATPMSTTSTTLTPTPISIPGTTTQCSIHTQPTAQHWIPGLILCCCLVSGTRTSQLPMQGVPRRTRQWRQRWIPAATALFHPPRSHGPLQPFMDLWRHTTQVDTIKPCSCNHWSELMCILMYSLCNRSNNQNINFTLLLPLCLCSSWTYQSKDVSLVLTDAKMDYGFTMNGSIMWLYQCMAAAPALYCKCRYRTLTVSLDYESCTVHMTY